MARLSHLALRVRDLDRMQPFYSTVMGLGLSDRGISARQGQEIAFLSGDAGVHHELALVAGAAGAGDRPVLDHLAFVVETLDGLRAIRDRAAAAGLPIRTSDHGNAWSIYFADPEGNAIEVFVTTPFPMLQPFGRGFDLDRTDAEIMSATRDACDPQPCIASKPPHPT